MEEDIQSQVNNQQQLQLLRPLWCGQHMANIHSSPLSPEFDTAYIPPIYLKSKDNAIFIELVYFIQGCYWILFLMDLSDDENVSKRELRQVADAFEYYMVG